MSAWVNPPLYDQANVAITGGNVEYVLQRANIPFISTPTGTMGNNGAFTSGTAMPRTIAKCYMYFAANQIAAGVAAGWYYATGSSTTAFTVFNNTYTSGLPTVPASPTAFSTTGPGATTGDTTTEVGPTIAIAANLLGANGYIAVHTVWTNNNSAGLKTPQVKFSTTAFLSQSLSTSLGFADTRYIANQNSTSAQICEAATSPEGATSGAVVTASIDTTSAQNLTLCLTKATATDFLILESYWIRVMTDGT